MAVEQTADRLTRLLAMMNYLAQHDRVPVAELAAHFGVPESQVLTDVDLLWVSGTPGYFHDDLIDFSVDDYEEALISLRAGRGLDRPVPLAPREALALVAAVEWLRASGTATGRMAEVLASVQAKLRGFVPAEVAPPPDGGADARAAISAAIESGSWLDVDYVSAEDRRTARVIRPVALYTDGAAWYLEAFCHLAGAQRTFRVDRFLRIGPAAGPPGSTDVAPQEVAATDVVLLLDRAARWLAEDIPDAVIRDVRGSDLIEVRVTLTRTDWLVRQLLPLGDQVRGVAPAALREELLARARAALEAYRAAPACAARAGAAPRDAVH